MPGSRSIWSAVLLTVSFYPLAWAAERPIDVEHSTVRVHVRKAGLFSAAGHEHWVTAPMVQGSVEEDEPSHVAFTFLARKLMVEPDKGLSTENQAEVQRTMQEKVLGSERYPEISSDQPRGRKLAAISGPSRGFWRCMYTAIRSVPLCIKLRTGTWGAVGSTRPTSAFNLLARAGPSQSERRTGY